MKYLLLIIAFGISITSINAQNAINISPYDLEHKQEKVSRQIKEAIDRALNVEKTKEDLQKKNTSQTMLTKFEKVVSDNPNSESEIFIAINPTDSNNIVISPILMDPTQSTTGLTCPVYYTNNGGDTWNKSDFLPIPFDKYDLGTMSIIAGGGDPVFAYDENGRLYFSWIYLYVTMLEGQPDSIYMEMSYAFSDNGGKDWTYDKNCTITEFGGEAKSKYSQGTAFTGRMIDKQWMAADLSDNSEYKGSVYLAAMAVDMYNGAINDIAMYLWRKLPGKDYFEKIPVKINKQARSIQGMSITVDNNGWVHVSFFYALNNETEFYHFVSKDGGTTFSEPNKITNFYGAMRSAPFYQTNNNNVGLNRPYPQNNIASDMNANSEYKNNLYLAWTANGATYDRDNGFDAYFSRSIDGGTTWETPLIINDDDTDNQNFYPFLTVNPRGVICATWYDRRDDVNDLLTDVYVAYSFDGGKTFSKNRKITSAPADFSRFIDGSATSFGIGEYNSLVATDGYCFPVWADGRRGDGKTDIYMAKLPISKDFTGVNEVVNISGTLSVSVAPMPVIDNANIMINSRINANATISIIDATGSIINTIENQNIVIGNNELSLDLTNYTSGVYFVNIVTPQAYSTKKFIVK